MLEISMTFPSAGDIIRLLVFEPDNIGVILGGFLKKYTHQSVNIVPKKYKGLHNQPIINVSIKNKAINGIPAGCIGVKIDDLIESIMFILLPIEFYYGFIILKYSINPKK